MNDELSCLDLLEATPAILRGLMSEISDEDARWKPVPDRFSIAEVLAHLSHSEGHCYRARVDRFLAEEMPELEPDDAQMHLALYKNGDPEEDFGHFEDQRETNIELLRGLPADAARARRSIARQARSRSRRCCTSGRCTTWGTCGRSRSWCGRGSTWRARVRWGRTIS
jgi:hypothetical protein